MKNVRTAACIAAAGAAAAMTLSLTPASAAMVKSHVIVSQGGSPVTSVIELTKAAPTTTVTATLDDNCLTVFDNKNNKQTFDIAAGVDVPGTVTVTPASNAPMTCGDSKTFTLTAIANVDKATVRFDAVAAEPGLQKQIAGASVQVRATGFDVTGGDPQPGHVPPAAPAVANSFVRANSDVAGTCQAHFDGAKSWHGKLAKAIARWAHEHHYNGPARQAIGDNSWILMVDDQVTATCTTD